ncbi:50S ribosomal protein L31 [Candidatus Daviesbacteria bacterium]|nr:50S ribosomal protein L31 [Candidatus Daviesbacteria bacterium]
MKQGIHPTWIENAKVVCACGSVFETGSVLPSIRVDICSKCHPLFTGQQKFVDILGQVDKFKKFTEKAAVKGEEKRKIKEARDAKVVIDKTEKPSLKDLLMQARKSLRS